MSDNSRRWILSSAAAVLLAAILSERIAGNPAWRQFSGQAFLDSLFSIRWEWALLGLAAIYMTYAVRTLRWMVLMRPVKPHPNFRNVFAATVVGFGVVGLFGRAGEMARPYMIARKEYVPVSSQIAVWLLERTFDSLTVLLIAAFAFARIAQPNVDPSSGLSRAMHVGGIFVALSTLGLIIVLVALRHYAEWLTRWALARLRFLRPSIYQKVEHHLWQFVEGSRSIRRWSSLAQCAFYSVVEWCLIALCYSAVLRSAGGGLQVSISGVLVFMGAVMVGSLVQIPGVGGGVQVAAVLVLTEWFHVKPEPAAVLALLIWLYTFLVVLPPAALMAAYEGWSWTKLRQLETET